MDVQIRSPLAVASLTVVGVMGLAPGAQAGALTGEDRGAKPVTDLVGELFGTDSEDSAAADDIMSGSEGDDRLDGGSGTNTADGGTGSDTCSNAKATNCE